MSLTSPTGKSTGFFTPRRTLTLILGLIALIVALSTVFGMTVTAPTGMRGVMLRFDKAKDTVLEPGLHFKWPYIEHVDTMAISIQRASTMADAVSSDLQQVHSEVVLNYHLSPQLIVDIYTNLRKDIKVIESDIIMPALQSQTKVTTGHYTAAQLITQRTKVTDEIRTLLETKLGHHGIVIDEFAVTNFQFSKSYADAIEAKTVAEQNVLTAQQDLEKAKVDAEQNVARANANAKVIAATAQANAEALRVQREQVTPALVELRRTEALRSAVEKWNGILPQTVLVGQGANPLLSIGEHAAAGKNTP